MAEATLKHEMINNISGYTVGKSANTAFHSTTNKNNTSMYKSSRRKIGLIRKHFVCLKTGIVA